jgi:prepilin-type N-terminal cleavage/methylation domain-containing protein
MTLRRGFTLLELLVAVTLMTGISMAVYGWIVGTARTSARFSVAARDAAAFEAIRAAIDDDLSCAVLVQGHTNAHVVRGALVMLTLNHAAGDPVGAGDVAWRFDPASRRIQRSVADAAAPGGHRIVAMPATCSQAEFGSMDRGRLGLFIDAHGERWSLPLWADPGEVAP